MSLKIMSIASGSHGNCTYISSETTHILVDAGVNLKRISDALKTIGVGITDLSGVVVTHEHDDHISGLSALSNAGVKVYAHERVMPHIARRIGPIPFENVDFSTRDLKSAILRFIRSEYRTTRYIRLRIRSCPAAQGFPSQPISVI